MVEKSIRGGLEVVSERYCKANNPNVDGYDPTQDENHILYLDVNNLYGYAMSQPLPVGNFEWVDVENNNIHQLIEECESQGYGMIIECDLIYPMFLHSLHDD